MSGRRIRRARRRSAPLAVLRLGPDGLRAGNRRLPCTIGRGGVRVAKREGDGATPAGRWRVTGVLYRADRMAAPVPWARPIGPRDLWCDDPACRGYNRPARAPHPGSAERLARGDRLYDLILLTDWNAAGVPGAGSAIFVHRWRGPARPTAGCIALPPRALAWLVRRLRPGTVIEVPAALDRTRRRRSPG
ncbi:MAG: hypothetical protein D6832_03740 [Alphaproteobacteria bacterium]|nr:MAG: hypothetical protein D6832_03740 [Alphaproteobacteria bacterium]